MRELFLCCYSRSIFYFNMSVSSLIKGNRSMTVLLEDLGDSDTRRLLARMMSIYCTTEWSDNKHHLLFPFWRENPSLWWQEDVGSRELLKSVSVVKSEFNEGLFIVQRWEGWNYAEDKRTEGSSKWLMMWRHIRRILFNKFRHMQRDLWLWTFLPNEVEKKLHHVSYK